MLIIALVDSELFQKSIINAMDVWHTILPSNILEIVVNPIADGALINCHCEDLKCEAGLTT